MSNRKIRFLIHGFTKLSENCAKRDYTNSAEIEKIYALMED